MNKVLTTTALLAVSGLLLSLSITVSGLAERVQGQFTVLDALALSVAFALTFAASGAAFTFAILRATDTKLF